MATVRFIGAPEAFYSASVTVIAALAIALAVELRLIRRKRLTLSDDPKVRRGEIRDAIFILTWPLASLVGLYGAFFALQSGGNRATETITSIGLAATVVPFYGLSTSIFMNALGQALPWSRKTRGVLLLIGGAVLVATGLTLAALGNP